MRYASLYEVIIKICKLKIIAMIVWLVCHFIHNFSSLTDCFKHHLNNVKELEKRKRLSRTGYLLGEHIGYYRRKLYSETIKSKMFYILNGFGTS